MCLVQKFKFDEKFKYSLKIQRKRKKETKERKKKKEKETNMSATTTSPQELLQCEEDSFIPDDPDDKFYDDNIYNWEVMFETVKFFLIKEGRWPRREREEDKRYVVMADDSIVLRDLAQWMTNQRQNKFKGKLLYERERKLDAIRFMWDRWEHEWHAMFCAVKRFKDKEGRWPRLNKAEDKREVVLADGKPMLRDLATWMITQKVHRDKLDPLREEMLNSIGFVWSEKEYNWKVSFDAVKSFKEKEGRWPRQKKAEDKREVVLADGKPVLRDLAMWMHNQKTAKSNGRMIPLREKKLREIDFPFHNRNKRKRQADPSSITTASRKKKKRTISDYL